MKKSTALEILRRYDGYSIATVGRPDICDAIVDANGQPFYGSVNVVYLWRLDREGMPLEGPESKEFPVRDYFALDSFADYLEEDNDGGSFSPWSGKGYLGGSCNGMIRLLPLDIYRVLYLLSSSVIRSHIHWTPEDDADDLKALGKGRLYADMGDWSPTRIDFDRDTLRLEWDSEGGAECLRKGEAEGFWIQWDPPEERDDDIEIFAEMERMLADAASQKPGGGRRDGVVLPEKDEEARHEDLF